MQKWTVQDRYGNSIYMTKERWEHVLQSRPGLEPYSDMFLETLRTGRRKRDSLVSNKYYYLKSFSELMPENSHIVVVVIFKTQLDARGEYVQNNFVLTGWANYIWSQR